jgi:exopolysaccharide biosynthesis WecB/TagA/CpsF family protein
MDMGIDGACRATSPVNFLGVQFDRLDFESALDAVSVRASLDLPFGYVVTPNVDHVVGLSREPGRGVLYDGAWLTLNDSRVLKALAARAGVSLPLATGADLAEGLLECVIDPREPITIIGADAASIAALKRRYRLADVRWHCPPHQLARNPEALVAAAAFAARQVSRFTFICVGAPQQEMIAYAIAQRGDATGVGLCCGAALDFLSGVRVRAPKWVRGLGLEWLHRLAREPRRLWRRYVIEAPAVFVLFAAWRASMAVASSA